MPKPRIYDSCADAVRDFPNGASLMIPGFGAGQPWNLLFALYHQGATDITAISNAITYALRLPDLKQLGDFIVEGRVKQLHCAFTASPYPSKRGKIEAMIREGLVEAEVMGQGTLAERIRAGGAGIPAFFTNAGVGTLVAEGKEERQFDGRRYIMERALTADYTFIRAHRADEAGNLQYRLAARNFNPIMAMAARTVIVEVEQPILPAGAIPPDQVHTPGVYVHRLVQIPPDGIFSVNRFEMDARMRAARAAALGQRSSGDGN